MGGIADYTGSGVAEMTLACAAAVAVQDRADRDVQVFSFNLFDEHKPFTLRVPLDALATTPVAALRAGFAEPGRTWAGYLAGCLFVLHEAGLIDLADPGVRGLNLAVLSTVPLGAGVSSSAAIEVATMVNLVGHFGLANRVDGLRVAALCQRVENAVVGAPCGIMDQVTSCVGEAGTLMRMVCQPHEIGPPLPLPAGVRVVGINSCVKHSIGGGRYGMTRCAAFMGHAILLDAMRQLGRAAGRELIADPMRGYLANLDPEDYKSLFRPRLPERIDGRSFLDRYGPTIDMATAVDPAADYLVLNADRPPRFRGPAGPAVRRVSGAGRRDAAGAAADAPVGYGRAPDVRLAPVVHERRQARGRRVRPAREAGAGPRAGRAVRREDHRRRQRRHRRRAGRRDAGRRRGRRRGYGRIPETDRDRRVGPDRDQSGGVARRVGRGLTEQSRAVSARATAVRHRRVSRGVMLFSVPASVARQMRNGVPPRPGRHGPALLEVRPSTTTVPRPPQERTRMSHWRPAKIPSLTGKVAVVTGGNSGIGRSAARELARFGATVVLACRNLKKATVARDGILSAAPGSTVELAELDLADLASVRAFADAFVRRRTPLDILVNNAGRLVPGKRQTTKDGFELTFGGNHLGPFAVTGLLLPALLDAPHTRVVTVSSIAHQRARMDFDDLQYERRKYRPFQAYAESKLANLLFGLELDRRLRKTGAHAASMVVHPGLSTTGFVANGPGAGNPLITAVATAAFAVAGQSADRGAMPTLFAATDPHAEGGKYYGPGGFMQFHGYPVELKAEPQAYDEAAAARLWDVSEQLTGVRYRTAAGYVAPAAATSVGWAATR